MWNQLIMEAMGEFESKNPGVLELLQTVNADNAWDTEKYGEAAMVLVEPNAYLCRHDEDLELFYNKCESEGMGFIKGVVQNDLWNHVIDLVNETGY